MSIYFSTHGNIGETDNSEDWFQITTDTIDMGSRSIKKLTNIELTGVDITYPRIRVEYKYDSTYLPTGAANVSFQKSDWVPCNQQGIAYVGVAGVEFRITVRGITDTYSRLDDVKLQWEPVDERGILR